MGPTVITTTAAVAGAGLDPTVLVGIVVALLALLGAPWWATAAARVGAVVLFGRRALPVEPAPPPVSDGGSAEDEERRAAYEVTAPIPQRGPDGNSKGNG